MKIKHSLKFETELIDESNPSVRKLLSLPKKTQVAYLESLLKALVAPKLTPILEELNKNGSWAILRLEEE